MIKKILLFFSTFILLSTTCHAITAEQDNYWTVINGTNTYVFNGNVIFKTLYSSTNSAPTTITSTGSIKTKTMTADNFFGNLTGLSSTSTVALTAYNLIQNTYNQPYVVWVSSSLYATNAALFNNHNVAYFDDRINANTLNISTQGAAINTANITISTQGVLLSTINNNYLTKSSATVTYIHTGMALYDIIASTSNYSALSAIATNALTLGGKTTSYYEQRFTTDETNIYNLGQSTGNLQTQANNLQIQISNIGVSTETIRTDLTALQGQTNNIVLSTSSLQTQINLLSNSVGVSTGNLQTQINNTALSTGSLQMQINNIGVSTASLQTQFNNILMTTSSITTQFNNIAISTANLQTQINNIALSTGIFQPQINSLNISTGNLQSSISSLGISTGNIQTQVNNIALSTGIIASNLSSIFSTANSWTDIQTINDISIGERMSYYPSIVMPTGGFISFAGTSVSPPQCVFFGNAGNLNLMSYNGYTKGNINLTGNLILNQNNIETILSNIQISTVSLQNQINSVQSQTNNIAISTGLIRTDLSALQNQVNQLALTSGTVDAQVRISTGIMQTQINALSLSTASLQTQISNISISTTILNNISVSTAALQSQINTLSLSTASLQYQINNLPVSSTSVTLSGNNTFTGTNTFSSTVTITGALIADNFQVTRSTTQAGQIGMYELSQNGDNVQGFEAADSVTDSLHIKFPNTSPADNSLPLFSAPSNNKSNMTYNAFSSADFSISSNIISLTQPLNNFLASANSWTATQTVKNIDIGTTMGSYPSIVIPAGGFISFAGTSVSPPQCVFYGHAGDLNLMSYSGFYRGNITMIGHLLLNDGIYTNQDIGIFINNLSISTESLQSQISTEVSNRTAINTATKDPTGFENVTTSTISLSGRVFTISGTDFPIWINGVKTLKSTENITVPDLSQLNFIYYDLSTGNITQSTSFPGFEYPLIATVYYSTQTANALLGDERHGISMPWATHKMLHSTVGTQLESGLNSAFAVAYSTVTSGIIHDEDLDISIPQTNTFGVCYYNGLNKFSLTLSTTNWVTMEAGVLKYNNGYALASVSNNNYVAQHIFATTDANAPLISITGQRQDSNLSNCQANATFNSLDLSNFPLNEAKYCYRVIYKNSGGTAVWQETDDYRNVTSLPTNNATAFTNFVQKTGDTMTGTLTVPDITINGISVSSATAMKTIEFSLTVATNTTDIQLFNNTSGKTFALIDCEIGLDTTTTVSSNWQGVLEKRAASGLASSATQMSNATYSVDAGVTYSTSTFSVSTIAPTERLFLNTSTTTNMDAANAEKTWARFTVHLKEQ